MATLIAWNFLLCSFPLLAAAAVACSSSCFTVLTSHSHTPSQSHSKRPLSLEIG